MKFAIHPNIPLKEKIREITKSGEYVEIISPYEIKLFIFSGRLIQDH
jgi:hypothetical protein|tara:strand:+ start:228 stop:368 length:141 start_codon:yes stop_codon:yes gene_type:complete